MTQSTTGLVEERCRYCGGAKRFQLVSCVSDHAWADCFCVKSATQETTIAELVAALEKARAEALEEAAQVCERQEMDFLSPEYATQQPMSSFQERFACRLLADAIRNLPPTKSRSAL